MRSQPSPKRLFLSRFQRWLRVAGIDQDYLVRDLPGPEVGTGLPAAILLAAVLIHKLGDAFTEVEACARIIDETWPAVRLARSRPPERFLSLMGVALRPAE